MTLKIKRIDLHQPNGYTDTRVVKFVSVWTEEVCLHNIRLCYTPVYGFQISFPFVTFGEKRIKQFYLNDKSDYDLLRDAVMKQFLTKCPLDYWTTRQNRFSLEHLQPYLKMFYGGEDDSGAEFVVHGI